MRALVMSIRPKYAEAILGGRKKWEFRTRLPAGFRRGSEAIVYETMPVGMAVGSFTAGTVYDVRILGDGSALLEAAGEEARIVPVSELARQGCVGEKDLEEYLRNGGKAAEVTAPRRLNNPAPLASLGLSRAPQSCAWARNLPGKRADDGFDLTVKIARHEFAVGKAPSVKFLSAPQRPGPASADPENAPAGRRDGQRRKDE